MKRRIYRILFAILAVVFLSSSAFLIWIMYSYKSAETEYNRLASLAVRLKVPDDSDSGYAGGKSGEDGAGSPDMVYELDMAHVLEIDFAALKKENADIVGWLYIPGTSVSYPLLQSGDNEFYLRRGSAKQNSSSGAIFMDSRNRADFSDDNTVIYGHNMRNGSMFGALKKYREKSFYEKHPYVDLYLPAAGDGQSGENSQSGRIRFEIYACYEEAADTDNFPVVFDGEEAQNAWLSEGVGKSFYDTGIRPQAGTHTLMLTTCTGRGYTHRWVVRASAVPEPETSAGRATRGR